MPMGKTISFVKGKEVYKLKEIERYCKTKILARKLPSKDDVTEVKTELIMEQLEQIMENTDLSRMIDYIENQINESDYTAMDIAAAFLHQTLYGYEDRENNSDDFFDFGDTGAEEGMVRLFMNIGKNQRIRPGDILGAIAGESGISGDLVGAIDMYDKYTFVEVPREYGKEVLKAMSKAKIKGKSINIEPANQK